MIPTIRELIEDLEARMRGEFPFNAFYRLGEKEFLLWDGATLTYEGSDGTFALSEMNFTAFLRIAPDLTSLVEVCLENLSTAKRHVDDALALLSNPAKAHFPER